MYTGIDIKRVFNEVLASPEALIISPWISGSYANRILEMVKNGKARVITSLDPNNEFIKLAQAQARVLKTERVRPRTWGKVLLITGILTLPLVILTPLTLVYSITSIILGLAYGVSRSVRRLVPAEWVDSGKPTTGECGIHPR